MDVQAASAKTFDARKAAAKNKADDRAAFKPAALASRSKEAAVAATKPYINCLVQVEGKTGEVTKGRSWHKQSKLTIL